MKRASGIELLRLIAMAMVMVLHANNYDKLDVVFSVDVVQRPLVSLLRILLQQSAEVCVDVFVLISGFFAIRPKWKSILNLLYIVIFWRIIGFGVSLYRGEVGTSVSEIITALNPMGLWFIRIYFELMLIAPMINVFCEKTKSKDMLKYIGYYYGVVFIAEHLMPLKMWGAFGRGFSVLAFVGLYLIGRYIKENYDQFAFMTIRRCMCMYLGLTVIPALTVYGLLFVMPNPGIMTRAAVSCCSYTSPFVILSAMSLLILFSKLKFQNGIVNHIAKSTFAIFVAHCPVYFINTVYGINTSYSGWSAFWRSFVFCFLLYWSIVVVDQIRLFSWSWISRRAQK